MLMWMTTCSREENHDLPQKDLSITSLSPEKNRLQTYVILELTF